MSLDLDHSYGNWLIRIHIAVTEGGQYVPHIHFKNELRGVDTDLTGQTFFYKTLKDAAEESILLAERHIKTTYGD